MVSAPLVSIGMPVYNGELFIRQAIESVAAQTYQNLEIIISDNASTDTTAQISLEYAARDSRIRYHRNDVNIGVYANFNRVFDLSSGEYFMWAAADDIRPRAAVEDCLKALLSDHGAVMCHGPILVKTLNNERPIEVSNKVELADIGAPERIRRFTRHIRHNGILYGLYRRQALALGTLGKCYGQDYLLCLQMCLLGSVQYVKKPIIILRERGHKPSTDPMYTDVDITVATVIKKSRMRSAKCWTVLLMGCYYLGSLPTVSLRQRLSAIAAHVSSFNAMHGHRLAKEIVFLLCEPITWLSHVSWHIAGRWSFSSRIARRLKAILGV